MLFALRIGSAHARLVGTDRQTDRQTEQTEQNRQNRQTEQTESADGTGTRRRLENIGLGSTGESILGLGSERINKFKRQGVQRERYRSGQPGQTVNLLAYAYGGSNPPLSTNFLVDASGENKKGSLARHMSARGETRKHNT